VPKHGDHGRRLSATERVPLLARVAAGDTHAMAAAAIRCSTKSIQRLFVHTGGLAPRRRRRSPLRLSLDEREDISRGLETGASGRAIARGQGRAPSTITRGIDANGGRTAYRAWQAERRAANQLQAIMAAPAPTYLALITIGDQCPCGARHGPACQLHLRVRRQAGATWVHR